jgi:hypothetical protein
MKLAIHAIAHGTLHCTLDTGDECEVRGLNFHSEVTDLIKVRSLEYAAAHYGVGQGAVDVPDQTAVFVDRNMH